MNARNFRWILLILTAAFLGASFFTEHELWAAAGFFICGSLWYWLVRRKARELDGSRPR
jgi:hypothetical protein